MSITLEDLELVLVEPSHAQQRILIDLLRTLQVTRVQAVETVEEALAAVRAGPPHAVLSAMHLPDGKGYDLLAALRGDEAYAELPFVLISSETRPAELEPVRQGGAVAILPKPCTPEQMVQALSATIDLLSREPLALGEEDIEDIRILVVDDSRTARRFVVQVLRQLGVESIVEAADGAEASQLLAERFFDVVLTDYNMPHMDGRALLSHIRHESNQRSVPVIMVTSEKEGARLAGVEREGVSAIIDKPFESAQVRALLARVLG